MSSSYISATLRLVVCERANYCCEYCLVPEAFTFASHEIDHIIAKKHGGEIIPLTSQGRVTVRLLQFNRQERIEERKLLIEAGILSSLET